MEMRDLFGGIYNRKKVLVTGHTGFKGSWLSYWLELLGAEVYGLALKPPTTPNHYDQLNLKGKSYIQDICVLDNVKDILKEVNPDIIFHLAAQPIVRLSYKDPIGTLTTNIMGTANILESSRFLSNLKAIVVITSDKCYENKEWLWGYRENEAMGGLDPYSSSKGCAELVSSAYRNSFYHENGILIATARAGNVIGGGDWAQDRIITDIITAANNSGKVFLRFPHATRPWQYVLEPLSGYLNLGQHLLQSENSFAEAWNFGPGYDNNVSVIELVKQAQQFWSKIVFSVDSGNHPHEAGYLMLDSSKAIKRLQWKPVWGFCKTVEQTISWYRSYYESNKVLSDEILRQYINDAQLLNIPWSLM